MNIDEINERIVSRPDILLGKPIVRGTRIPIYLILDLSAAGMTAADIVDDYPDLTERDVEAALTYASQRLQRVGHPLLAR